MKMANRTKEVCIIAALTALNLATNYALIGIHNVKLMDLIVFVSGFCFGSITGALIGILTWCIYGTLNPYGFSLPIFIATSLCEAIYGVSGGLIRRTLGNIEFKRFNLLNFKFAILGFLLTFLYDLLTNVVYAFTFGIPLIFALAYGVPFAIAHEVSNAVFFMVGAPALIFAVNRLMGVKEE